MHHFSKFLKKTYLNCAHGVQFQKVGHNPDRNGGYTQSIPKKLSRRPDLKKNNSPLCTTVYIAARWCTKPSYTIEMVHKGASVNPPPHPPHTRTENVTSSTHAGGNGEMLSNTLPSFIIVWQRLLRTVATNRSDQNCF